MGEQATLRGKCIQVRSLDIGVAISTGIATVIIGDDQDDVPLRRGILRGGFTREQDQRKQKER
jgi:hypothetical protein